CGVTGGHNMPRGPGMTTIEQGSVSDGTFGLLGPGEAHWERMRRVEDPVARADSRSAVWGAETDPPARATRGRRRPRDAVSDALRGRPLPSVLHHDLPEPPAARAFRQHGSGW